MNTSTPSYDNYCNFLTQGILTRLREYVLRFSPVICVQKSPRAAAVGNPVILSMSGCVYGVRRFPYFHNAGNVRVWLKGVGSSFNSNIMELSRFVTMNMKTYAYPNRNASCFFIYWATRSFKIKRIGFEPYRNMTLRSVLCSTKEKPY